MIAYLLRSLAQAVVVMLAVALIAFAMFRFVGDPVANMVGQEASVAERSELAERLGLNDPVPVQFGRFVLGIARGEFGMSYRQGRPVVDLLAERLPATVELAVLSSLLALALGIVLGVYAAINRRGVLANAVMSLSLLGVSLPTFLIGIGLIYLFAVELRWLPSFGRGEVVALRLVVDRAVDRCGRKSLIMPTLTLGFYQLTLIMRLVRAEMLEALRTDYVKFARARGIPERTIRFRHALRNTMIPVTTIAGLQLGSVIAFAIVTESVFQWPGLGALFVQAVQFVDIPVMAAYLMFVALVFVIVNLAVDLLYFVARSAAARSPRRRRRGDDGRASPRSRARGTARRATGIPTSPGAIAIRRSRSRRASWRSRWCSARVFAPWLAPHNPFDAATLNLMEGFSPPGEPSPVTGRVFLLGTDSQGRDVFSAILYGSRVSLLVGFASVLFSVVLGVTLGLVSGYLGGRTDAVIMRIADMQLSFPAILIALLVFGVARGLIAPAHHEQAAIARPDRRHRPVALGAICAHRARLDPGREEQGLRAGRARDGPLLVRHHARARAAERDRTGAGHRHHQSRARRHRGGDAFLSRGRRAADAAVARHADPRRPAIPVLGRMVDSVLSLRLRWCCWRCRSICWATGCATRSIPRLR